MIPLKLQIKNFVSYGPTTQTVNFEPYHLICLSGKNGHGKSALLDAITWAIWGQARKTNATSKADDGLLRLGQTNMMVCLDFLCNNITYRIRREYTVNGNKSISNLDFAFLDNNNFKSLTDKTIKVTQDKIENMIGLTFDSFINSAFLRQGQSNEFSKKTSKERKDILANILGLEKFEKIRKLALEKGRIAVLEKEGLSRFLEQTKKEFDQQDNLILEFANTNNYLEILLKEDLENSQKIEIIKKQTEEILNIKNIISQFDFQKNQILKIINEKHQILKDLVFRWRKTLKEQRKKIDFKRIESEKETIENDLNKIHLDSTNKLILKEKCFLKKEEENNYLQKINLEFNQKLETIKLDIQKNYLCIIPIQEKIKEHENILNQKQDVINKLNLELLKFNLLPELNNEEKIFEKRKNYYQKFVAQLNMLKTKLKDNIDNNQNINQDHANCPLCKQNIDQEYKENLYKLLKKENSLLNHQIKKLESTLNNLKTILIEQNENIENIKIKIELEKTLNKENQEIINISLTNNNLKTDLENLLIIKNNLEIQEKKYNIDFENTLKEDFYYLNLKLDIENLSKEIDKIKIDKEIEEQLKSKLKLIEIEKNNYADLIKEINLQDEKKENISKICKEIKELKKQIVFFDDQINQNLKLCINEKDVIQVNQELLIKQKDIVLKKEELILKKGALEEHLKILERKQKDYQEHLKEIKILETAAQEYNIIASALSKDGIQALLIEDAIPEIEHEANQLLAKLTDNQAQLYIESLRDLRSGGTKETLDIKISDPMGIRPYELFSGGEAFRIDFALRVAISKLLARRAGTSLQTLIIDEGFGSQDEEGLANIMDSIHKIQEDFAKVIIVSHLPSMKDQFPTNFYIHKGPNGSQIKVIEQG